MFKKIGVISIIISLIIVSNLLGTEGEYSYSYDSNTGIYTEVLEDTQLLS